MNRFREGENERNFVDNNYRRRAVSVCEDENGYSNFGMPDNSSKPLSVRLGLSSTKALNAVTLAHL